MELLLRTLRSMHRTLRRMPVPVGNGTFKVYLPSGSCVDVNDANRLLRDEGITKLEVVYIKDTHGDEGVVVMVHWLA